MKIETATEGRWNELKGGYKMTTKEAIQIMKKWYKMGNDGLITGLTEEDDRLGYLDGWFTRSDKEAFNLAISALGVVIDQLKWERDMALEQLEELQHSFKTTMGE